MGTASGPAGDSDDAGAVEVQLDGDSLALDEVVAVARGSREARLAPSIWPRLEASQTVVDRIVAASRPVYGVTTGFGSLSDRVVLGDHARELQTNLLRSHAVGAGEPLPTEVVRAAIVLRANSLARGYSGIRPIVITTLLALLNAGVHPVVPSQGSLGASGDLAPLAHLALPLLGLGQVEVGGEIRDAATVLREQGIAPLTLEPKEALALINGTQVMTALGVLSVIDAERLVNTAVSVAGLSLCALGARRAPLDRRLHEVRPHPGQVAVARRLRHLLAPVPLPSTSSARIQDPYSIRCIPQVYGAVSDSLQPFRRTLEIEANAATDNPLIFAADDPGDEVVLSGGNFHGHPLALGADAVKIAVASLGTIVERRIALLVDGADRGLPPCLAREPGVDSGYMVAHYLAASLVAENRVLAHPASVDSIPTSASIEDFNSMGATAALHLRQVVANVETVVAVEAICAAQACDLAGRVPSGPLGDLHRRIRSRIPVLEHDDRILAGDIAAVVDLVCSGELVADTAETDGADDEPAGKVW